MLFKVFAILPLFVGLFLNVSAQSAPVSIKMLGQVLDQNGTYLPSATVMILSNDTSLLKTTLADELGHFKFDNLYNEHYIIKVSLVGYIQDSIFHVYPSDTSANNFKNIVIKLRQNKNMLEEVVIERKKPPIIEKKIDKLIFNIENSGLNIGNSAYDILQRSPGVSMDENGTISLNGQQGVTILINDRPTYLSQSQLTAYLKSLRGEELSKIEIMANPSSKYDAAGTAILNIKTKTNNRMGFNGNIYLTHSQSKYASNYGGISINYKNNRFNASVGYNGGLEKYWNTNESTSLFSSTNLNSILKNNSSGDYRSFRNNIKANLTYELNERNTLAFSTTNLLNSYKTLNYKSKNEFYSTNGIDSTSITSNTGTSKFNSNQYNLAYNSELDTLGSKISGEIDYSVFKSPSNLDFKTDFVSNLNGSQREKLINNNNPINTKIKAFKIDYTKIFRNNAQLELGMKASQVKLQNENIFTDIYGSVHSIDSINSNSFKYKERILSIYLNFNIALSKKIVIQSGLRIENTFNEGFQVKSDSIFTNRYTNFFPSFVIQDNLNENNTLSLSYSKRINRPQYDYLNPFKYIVNDFSYQIGNPYLMPELTNSFEFSHVFKSKFVTSFFYKTTSNIISTIVNQNDITKVTVSTYDNISKAKNMGFSINGSFSIGERIFFQNMFSLYNNKFNGEVNRQLINVNATSFTLSQYFQISLPKNYKIDFNWNYQSGKSVGIYDFKPIFTFNTSLKKRIGNNLDIGLNINDVFNTLRTRSSILQNGIDATYVNKTQSQKVSLSLNYSFGNSKLKINKKESSGFDTEKDRSVK
ncbi:TonB-dependent receptor domain-containing protein [uncultured Sphingobacterium sp.]|uniref:TonB-dependent receptor domain-containing protein n=1 Tax=uncultured Sphingobacterium sp. TaxID=182688 RepID=UPI00374A276D